MTNQKNKEKWTETELLPEWDEEFYDIYTARKYGKWVMFKALKEKYRDDPRFQAMISKEFDVRYNLAHPNIIMINDFEEIPGIGMAIVTDDVYGTSLRKLIDRHEVTEANIRQITTRLTDAIDYIQQNHIIHFPITPDSIIFTENIGNLKLINVGFDQHSHLTPAQASEDIRAFGHVLREALSGMDDPDPSLERIADKCLGENGMEPYKSVHALRLALDKRSDRTFYIVIIALLAITISLLIWFATGHVEAPAT
ncbi:MAG: protein kinase [Clostridium sp.]|nr:protein kinase [Clostridium sp.]